MKNSFLFLLIGFTILSFQSVAQEILTLEKCQQQAETLFPLVNQVDKLRQINDLQKENLNAGYLPSLNLNGKITYQSTVTEVPIAMPGVSIPTVPLDQYSATVDVNQLLYDGGAIKAGKAVTDLSSQTQIQQVEVDIYKLKEQINQLYFASLALQENINIIQLTKATVAEQRKLLESSVKNGIVNESELDNLDAELLKINQQLIELESNRKQTLNALSQLTTIDIPEDARLMVPKVRDTTHLEAFRPEHQLFADRSDLLDANLKMVGTKRMPKIMVFGTAGYGNPGLNMYSGQFETYYMLGAQVNWKIWDWKQTSRKKQQLTLQKQLITDNEDAFNRNLAISISDAQLRNEKLQKLIEQDKAIIELRTKISERSASQLENGIKNSADYLADLNAEKQARINLKSHEIQWVQSEIDYRSLCGKPLFTEK